MKDEHAMGVGLGLGRGELARQRAAILRGICSRSLQSPDLSEAERGEWARARARHTHSQKAEAEKGSGGRREGRESFMDGDQQGTSVEERVRAAQVEARARHIAHNVRCLECGHQSIEESAADIAVRLRKVIRDDIRAGRSDKEIYERLTTEYGETILYSPAFDAQTAVLWLGPVAVIGAIAGTTFYRGRAKQRDVGRMADALLHGIPLSPAEHRMLKSLVLPPSQRRAWTWPSLWKL